MPLKGALEGTMSQDDGLRAAYSLVSRYSFHGNYHMRRMTVGSSFGRKARCGRELADSDSFFGAFA